MVENGLHFRSTNSKRRITDRRRNRFERCARGNDDRWQRHQREHQSANDRSRLRKPYKIYEQCKAENTEHNRWNGGQVGNVDFDQIGPAILRRKLLEINRRSYTDRKRQNKHDQHHICRAENCHTKTGGFRPGVRGIRRCEEGPVKAKIQNSGFLQSIGKDQLFGRNVSV